MSHGGAVRCVAERSSAELILTVRYGFGTPYLGDLLIAHSDTDPGIQTWGYEDTGIQTPGYGDYDTVGNT